MPKMTLQGLAGNEANCTELSPDHGHSHCVGRRLSVLRHATCHFVSFGMPALGRKHEIPMLPLFLNANRLLGACGPLLAWQDTRDRPGKREDPVLQLTEKLTRTMP